MSLLVVMLGTNDTKERLGANACAIGKGLRRLCGRHSPSTAGRAGSPTF